jgi:hypothetical protein
MKNILFTVLFLFVGFCIKGQHLYVQTKSNSEQTAFAIAQKPKITFGNGTLTIQQTPFQLNNVQNLSFVKNQTTNVRDLETENSLQIYPNPVNYELTITNYDFQQGDLVELFDINGRRVYSTRANGNEKTIDMSIFQSGNYILRIGNRVARIVKQ